jgi:hypothetical protein
MLKSAGAAHACTELPLPLSAAPPPGCVDATEALARVSPGGERLAGGQGLDPGDGVEHMAQPGGDGRSRHQNTSTTGRGSGFRR